MKKTLITLAILSGLLASSSVFSQTVTSISPFFLSGSNIVQQNTSNKLVANKFQIASSTTPGYVAITDAFGNIHFGAAPAGIETDPIWTADKPNYLLTSNFGTPFYNFFSATNTNALAEGSNNLYWTNTRFDNRLSATSSISGITTLPNLSITKSQVSDFGVYEAPLTFTYPLVRSVNTISSALSTTTSNTWAGTQTFNTIQANSIGTSGQRIPEIYANTLRTQWLEVSANVIDSSMKIGSSTNPLTSSLLFENIGGLGTLSYSTGNIFNFDKLVNMNAKATTTQLTVSDKSWISIPKIGTPTFSTVSDNLKLITSAGRMTGGTITNNGNGTLSVAAGTGFIKAMNDDTAEILSFDWVASTSVPLAINSQKFIGIEYNGGNPRVVSKNSDTFDLNTEFSLGTAVNSSNDVHILNNHWWVGDGITNVIERLQSFGQIIRDDHVGGLMISVVGTRNVAMTSGKLWSRLNEINIAATSTASFELYYRDGIGNWTISKNNAQYPVLQFDNGSGTLANLGLNKYANFWVFVEVDGDVALLYPQMEHNTAAQADAESVPSTLPLALTETGLFLGKILFKQATDAPISVSSAFTTAFTSSAITNHANLSNLDFTNSGHTGFAGLGATNVFTGTNSFVGLTNTGTATTTSLAITGSTGLLKGNGSTAPVSIASAGVDYENPLLFTYPLTRSTNTISLALATTTSNTWAGTQTFATATTTSLFVSDPSITVGSKKIYPRWNDRMSIPSATSTDETMKFGSCLESSGPSVTISKIDTHIASTTGSLNAAAEGIAWNLNIANATGSSTPMTAFSSVKYSQGTSTVQTFIPDSTTVIPSGYCYWFAPTVASTTQIQMFYLNIFGYEN